MIESNKVWFAHLYDHQNCRNKWVEREKETRERGESGDKGDKDVGGRTEGGKRQRKGGEGGKYSV